MLLLDAETRGREIIESHYDALIVELFGVNFSGITRERLEFLLLNGYIQPSQLQGLDYHRGQGDPLNPILFIRRLGRAYVQANNAERESMRRWDIGRWRRETLNLGASPSLNIQYPTLSRPTPSYQMNPPNMNRLPPNFGSAEKAGLVSAFQTTGGFIRGLGAKYVDEYTADLYEEWDGENLLRSPDPVRRQNKLDVIRQEVGTAVLTKTKASEVARRIRSRVGDMARDFERIAETELQAVHNEGQIYQGIDLYGNEALIARIPEANACSSCLELSIDPVTSEPYLFNVIELANNGTNVGRKRKDWKATAFPIHPNCRCDIIPLGPDQKADRLGRVKAKT